MDESAQSPSFGSSMPPLAYAGQRIGVMGGTFNPPHEGHALVATTALRRLKLDQLWWMVTPGNPLKSGNGLPPLAERLAASRRLVTDPRIAVTGFEEGLGQSYTYATLTHLTGRMPGVHFVWVMGADNLASFHRWRRWREIAELVPIAVVDRPGWRFRALASPAAVRLMPFRIPEMAAGRLAMMRPPAWVFLSTRLSGASSTALRGAV
ncbi:putative nicotinate-nucleotide adenylyltransferase [Hyphomicrobium sp. 1Nfss2.1]|uniref:nicotinate-nucleotide adenylyltransferase n=1 Tax=Hyphomicrobium sp. 1Nfss2.1 TaxID=3413936 RepID=UPI003C7E444D